MKIKTFNAEKIAYINSFSIVNFVIPFNVIIDDDTKLWLYGIKFTDDISNEYYDVKLNHNIYKTNNPSISKSQLVKEVCGYYIPLNIIITSKTPNFHNAILAQQQTIVAIFTDVEPV